MNKRYITITGSGLVKLLTYGSFCCLMILLGCKKDQLDQQNHSSRNSAGSLKRTVRLSSPCGRPYETDLIAGQNMDAGKVTIYNTADSLYIFVETEGDWKMTSTKIYAGTLAGMPQTGSGNPKVGLFPYKKNFQAPVTSSFTAIPLSLLQRCYIVAVHIDLKQIVNGTVVQAQTGWGNGIPMSGNNWAMYSN